MKVAPKIHPNPIWTIRCCTKSSLTNCKFTCPTDIPILVEDCWTSLQDRPRSEKILGHTEIMGFLKPWTKTHWLARSKSFGHVLITVALVYFQWTSVCFSTTIPFLLLAVISSGRDVRFMAGQKIPEPVAEVYSWGHHLSGYRPGGFSRKLYSPSCSPARRAGCFLRAGEVSAPRGKVIKFDPGSIFKQSHLGSSLTGINLCWNWAEMRTYM